MVQKSIENIEKKIRTDKSIPEKSKTELLDLLEKLKSELVEYSSLKSAVDTLKDTVKDFEISHPKLVEDVNYIATGLSNIGL